MSIEDQPIIGILDENAEPCSARLWSWGGKDMAVIGNRVLLPLAFNVLAETVDPRNAQFAGLDLRPIPDAIRDPGIIFPWT